MKLILNRHAPVKSQGNNGGTTGTLTLSNSVNVTDKNLVFTTVEPDCPLAEGDYPKAHWDVAGADHAKIYRMVCTSVAGGASAPPYPISWARPASRQVLQLMADAIWKFLLETKAAPAATIQNPAWYGKLPLIDTSAMKAPDGSTFTQIMIHAGNDVTATHGCVILTGLASQDEPTKKLKNQEADFNHKNPHMRVGPSRLAVARLLLALIGNPAAELEIIEAKPPATALALIKSAAVPGQSTSPQPSPLARAAASRSGIAQPRHLLALGIQLRELAAMTVCQQLGTIRIPGTLYAPLCSPGRHRDSESPGTKD